MGCRLKHNGTTQLAVLSLRARRDAVFALCSYLNIIVFYVTLLRSYFCKLIENWTSWCQCKNGQNLHLPPPQQITMSVCREAGVSFENLQKLHYNLPTLFSSRYNLSREIQVKSVQPSLQTNCYRRRLTKCQKRKIRGLTESVRITLKRKIWFWQNRIETINPKLTARKYFFKSFYWIHNCKGHRTSVYNYHQQELWLTQCRGTQQESSMKYLFAKVYPF